MKRINFSTLLMAQEAQDKEEPIRTFSTPPVTEPAPPPWRVTETRLLYNPTCPLSHSPFQSSQTSSSGYHLWSATPLGDLTQMQYFDLLAPPAAPLLLSSPNSSLLGFPSPIYIDPLSDNKDDDNIVDIKATLPEEFNGEIGDANRWLMAIKTYFILHVDKFPNKAQTVVFLNRMSKGWGKAFAEAWLIKLKDEYIPDADKNWTKIKKAFKAAFTPYDTAAQAWVALTSLNQDQKNLFGFDKYIFSFLLSIHSGITDYHILLE